MLSVYGPQFTKDGLAFMYTERSDIVQAARVMWTEMGDQLSRQYSGTDSTIARVSSEGKEGLEGKIAHKTVAVKRFFLNTVGQNPMQLSIEILLGKFLNLGYSVQLAKFIKKELAEVKQSISTTQPLSIFVGTWNCGGVKAYDQIDLTPWLVVSGQPDLYVLHFQEAIYEASRLIQN